MSECIPFSPELRAALERVLRLVKFHDLLALEQNLPEVLELDLTEWEDTA